MLSLEEGTNLVSDYWKEDFLEGSENEPSISNNDSSGDTSKNKLVMNKSSAKEAEVYECVIIGAGAAGIGVGIALVLGGMKRSNLLLIEKNTIGSSFATWNNRTRFISPSWPSNPFGSLDLNSIDPFSSVPNTIPHYQDREMFMNNNQQETNRETHHKTQISSNQSHEPHTSHSYCNQHPSGKQYANYLNERATHWKLPIRENCEVQTISKIQGSEAWPSGGFLIDLKENSPQCNYSENCATGKNKETKGQRIENSETGRTIYSRYVIWCGGEWSFPKLPIHLNHPSNSLDSNSFQESSFLHYVELGKQNISYIDLVERANKSPVKLMALREDDFEQKVQSFTDSSSKETMGSVAVIVGAYEAGVDVACGLIESGIDQIYLVDSEDYIQGWIHPPNNRPESYLNTVMTDPSASLAPISVTRLKEAHSSGKLCLRSSTYCTRTHCSYPESSGTRPIFRADLKVLKENGKIANLSIDASIPIIFCSGFCPSMATPIKNLMSWSDPKTTNGPDVSQSCDESLKTPGLFICGPMLRHTLNKNSSSNHNGFCEDFIDCADSYIKGDAEKADKSHASQIISNETKELAEIIFCFIYKFRTRFAVVAGEILSRLVYEDHCTEYIFDEKKDIARNDVAKIRIDKIGHERLDRLEKMFTIYKDKGMLVNCLSIDHTICCSFSG